MEFSIEYLREKNPLRGMSPMQASTKALQWLIVVALLWTYNTKMLAPTIESITSMSRSYTVNGVQQNPAFYESITLSSAVILVSLFFFILARNEVTQVIKGDRSNFSDYSTTLAGIVISVLIIVLCSIDNPLLDFSPAKGMPFLIVGSPVLLAYYLVSNDLERIEDGKREPILYARIAAPLVLYILLAMNISMVPPVISSNLPAFFSASLILMTLVMIIQISSETGNPQTHERRNSTMILILGLPLILYMTTRLLYLLHNPDSVTRERWDLSWEFMEMKNTFEINAWPLQPDFPEDVRWEFLKGAILNSIRATLLAIVLCTFLGTIIGVTRLSSNKLASGLATIYVEIFRNMPLAVLLFLVTLQLGTSLPRFFDEASIAGWVYYSNQGIFIPKPETLRMILALGIVFSLWAWGKYRDREEVDDSSQALMRRSLVWSAALVVCLGLLLSGDMSLPNYVKPNLDLPGTWNIEKGSAFEITVEFIALIIGLTLFTAAVVAEIVRGSIQALPRGQVEAAISLGLSPYQRLRLVILPQALRSMIPLLNSQYMNVWKNSSLAIIVAYSDIFYVIFVMMNNVGKLIPLFLLLLVTYQAGSLLISGIMNFYNARVTKVKI
jgi:general L-amino acid transport system permease protein